MRQLMSLLILSFCTNAVCADESAFTTGPVFKDYGPVADIVTTMPIPPGAVFRHSFDVSAAAPALLQQQGYTLNPF